MSYYCYILFSKTKNRYYTGSCSDIQQRLKRHNDGATPSTKPGRPWKVVWSEEHLDKIAAIKRENEIKRKKSRIYIEQLIAGSAG